MNLIIQGGALPTFLLDRILTATGASTVEPRPPQVVRLLNASRTPAFDELIPLIEAEKLDWAFVPAGKKLADFAGKKAEVSEVTEAAMRGEIDYRESLRRRLALMAGLDARVLARVFGERLLLSDGARELLEACQNAGLRTAILSGGFTYFTERLRIELGLDFATSNELEIVGGKLSGRVVGDIVDASAKAHHLLRLRNELGLTKDQVIACGDGANDLLMMAEAGLSVAFRAKPATRAKADVAINFGGLDALLNLFD